jgi:hypothetical protein
MGSSLGNQHREILAFGNPLMVSYVIKSGKTLTIVNRHPHKPHPTRIVEWKAGCDGSNSGGESSPEILRDDNLAPNRRFEPVQMQHTERAEWTPKRCQQRRNIAELAQNEVLKLAEVFSVMIDSHHGW